MRYHLYVSLACPWAHRTLLMRTLKGLEDIIPVSVVHPLMLENGWTFGTDFPAATGDNLYHLNFAYEVYLRAQKDYTGRVTVPILWDKKQQTIVSNESADILRMFNSAFDAVGARAGDFCWQPGFVRSSSADVGIAAERRLDMRWLTRSGVGAASGSLLACSPTRRHERRGGSDLARSVSAAGRTNEIGETREALVFGNLQRGVPLGIRQVGVGARGQQQRHRFAVRVVVGAKQHGLNECSPPQLVHVVNVDTGIDQHAHCFNVPVLGGGNQCSSAIAIGAADIGAVREREREYLSEPLCSGMNFVAVAA